LLIDITDTQERRKQSVCSINNHGKGGNPIQKPKDVEAQTQAHQAGITEFKEEIND
jgi:hypothetical protein